MAVLGAILCGGQSRRFGGDKSLAVLGGETLLARAIGRARPQVSSLVLAVGPDPKPYVNFDAECVTDAVVGEGPLAGIISVLAFAAARGSHNVASFACDTPFFPRDLVERLAAADPEHQSDCMIAAQGAERHRIFALWRVAALPRLRDAFAGGMRKMAHIEGVIHCVSVEIPAASDAPQGHAFFNINTSADMAMAEAYLKSASAFSKV